MRADGTLGKSLDMQSGVARGLARAALLAYRYAFAPVLHATQRTLTGSAGCCRFQPSCSEYAALAVAIHGPMHGAMLALRRILRCHPFCRGGFDPVPASPGSEMPAALSSCIQQENGARHLPWEREGKGSGVDAPVPELVHAGLSQQQTGSSLGRNS